MQIAKQTSVCLPVSWINGWEFKIDSLDSSQWSLEHTEEKIEKNCDVDFHTSLYFSVFLNIESISFFFKYRDISVDFDYSIHL